MVRAFHVVIMTWLDTTGTAAVVSAIPDDFETYTDTAACVGAEHDQVSWRWSRRMAEARVKGGPAGTPRRGEERGQGVDYSVHDGEDQFVWISAAGSVPGNVTFLASRRRHRRR